MVSKPGLDKFWGICIIIHKFARKEVILIMKKRNPFLVFFLPYVTFGIYALWWDFQTTDEMNTRGAAIPIALLAIVPIVNWYWMWKFSQGVETVTRGGMGTAAAFCWCFFLGTIGMAVVQSALNKVTT